MEYANSTNSKPLFLAALLALIVGVGTGGYALVASLGVWVGIWDFRQGFSILGQVNQAVAFLGDAPLSACVAVFCAIVAVVVLLLAKLNGSNNAFKLFSFAAIGAIASAIAWYIPTTFQPGEGQPAYPPIHDVSTDTVNPPTYLAVLPLRAESPNTVVYGGSRGMTHAGHAKLQMDAYPDLVPQLISATPEEIFERALTAVDAMGWELVDASPADGRIEATATTFWFRFKDDIVIRIQEQDGQSLVDARSLSRVGGGDAGANAIRLRKFFEIL